MAHKTAKRNSLYADLMDELQVRLEIIAQLANGRGSFDKVIIREFCYLQLRMLCELVALSCLVAHGDVAAAQAHKLGKSYSADDILDRLAKLRPHFYPDAVKPMRKGPHEVHMEGVQPSPFPKEELLALYGKTHRHLHRGTLKRLLSSEKVIDTHVNLPEIVGFAQKFADLLAHHVISVGVGHVIYCELGTPDGAKKVRVFTAEAQRPS